MFMDLLQVFLTALGSIAVLFLLTKLMGRKQMSELSMFDYIVGISIGSIAAEMATNLENFTRPLLAMVLYALTALIVSVVDSRSVTGAKYISGQPLVLYKDQKIYEKALKKSKLGVQDLLMQARLQGYSDLSELKLVLLEVNGKLSFLPLSSARPLTPKDMNLVPTQQEVPLNVVVEGRVLSESLKKAGVDEAWLSTALSRQGIGAPSQLLLATLDSNKTLRVYSR